MATIASPSGVPAPDLPWVERDPAGRHAMLTELLARVSSEALLGETLEAVLQRIVDCLVQRLPVAIASIILLNDEGTHFVQEVWGGELELDLPEGFPWPVSTGAAGRCAREGVAQLIADVEHDPDYVPGNRHVRSEYLVPIRHRERLHGVLNLESTRADFFTPDARAVFDAIARQIAGAIHLARVVRELELANRQLQQWSMSDGLTGIANRRCFDQRLAEEWLRHLERRSTLALLLVDADQFKRLNDAHGHLYGDDCLRALARLCQTATDPADALVARYGGEELALLLPRHDLLAARRFAESLRQRVEAEAIPHPDSSVAPFLTVSIGVAVSPRRGIAGPEELIAAADRALYAAKAGGRNRVMARGAPVRPRNARG